MYSTQRWDRNKLHALSGWAHAIAREHGWSQKCVQQFATFPAVLGFCFTLFVVDFSTCPVFSQTSTWKGLGQAGCSSFLALGHQGVSIPSSRTCNALSGSKFIQDNVTRFIYFDCFSVQHCGPARCNLFHRCRNVVLLTITTLFCQVSCDLSEEDATPPKWLFHSDSW